jgi:hypothetical protein
VAPFGQCLTLLTEPAPPHYALYGTVNAMRAEFEDIDHPAAAPDGLSNPGGGKYSGEPQRRTRRPVEGARRLDC